MPDQPNRRRVWVLLEVIGYSEGGNAVGVVTDENVAKEWAEGGYRDCQEFELDVVPDG